MASNSNPGHRNWANLSPDLTANILHRLGAIEILMSAQEVCSNWYKVTKDPAMWRVIDMHNRNEFSKFELQKMCMHAVDRSQGQLIDIKIAFFGDHKLLDYIADRSSQLKRLQLVHSDASYGLKDAVTKLPLLEEVHLIYSWISEATIQRIGRSCPLLKSFKFEERRTWAWKINKPDEVALAIAKTMPGLRHLSLFGKQVSENGLTIILDGCPLLESLDLRLCEFDLKGDLLKRCMGQFKDFKGPLHSTEDHMFEDPIYYESEESDDDMC